MSKNQGEAPFFLFPWVKRLALGLIGLFSVALVHSMVGKWAEANHWDQFLIQITGPPFSTFFGFLIGQHWFWFLGGVSVGTLVGSRAANFFAKQMPGTGSPIEGIESIKTVETETDVDIRRNGTVSIT
jgi:hypothetical protein